MSRDLLHFSVAGCALCVEVRDVLQVVYHAAWMRNPEGHDLYGWLFLDTQKIPLFDGASLLGLPASPGSKQVLVLKDPRGPAALLVDRVEPGLTDFRARRPLPQALEQVCQPCFLGLVPTERAFAFVCCPRRLLAGFAGTTTAPEPPSQAWEESAVPAGEPLEPRLFLASLRVASKEWGKLFFGFSLAQVAEVIDPLPVVPVPSDRAHVGGMVRWRAQPVPLLDLARLILGLPAVPHSRGRLLVLRCAVAGEYLSCAVDPDSRVEPLSAAFRTERHPALTDPALVKAVFRFEDALVLFPGTAAGPGGKTA